ncbi:MAG: hypothetical protein ABIU29_05590 [Chthoniobacterales bacterium]
MKQNTFTKLFAAGAVCAITLGTALAQTSTTVTTDPNAGVSTGTSVTTGTTTGSTSATTSTSTMDGTGTITTYSPGSDYIMFRSESSAEPMKYYYSKSTTVVDPTGATVEMSMLKPDMPVRYTYTKEGDRMVITKVTLEKPISYYKKETTTTTTTTP